MIHQSKVVKTDFWDNYRVLRRLWIKLDAEFIIIRHRIGIPFTYLVCKLL